LPAAATIAPASRDAVPALDRFIQAQLHPGVDAFD
jgi:hypothetical protein